MIWLKEFIACFLSDYVMPVNIGNPDEISLKDFAEEVLELTGNKVKLFINLCRWMIRNNRQPDITKGKELLDGSRK